MPLPPYIRREAFGQSVADTERYQTVYADPAGSVAAPTAGLHFTEPLLDQIRSQGVETHTVTLHVRLGTFAPVKAEALGEHAMHTERYTLPPATAEAINLAKAEGRRVIAVGTTTVRVGKCRRTIPPAYYHQRQHGHFHLSAAPVCGGGCVNHQFPPTSIHPTYARGAFASPGALDGRELMLETYAEAVPKNIASSATAMRC